jgi:hypothetical protein
MKKRDRRNLQFLLSLDEMTLLAWYLQSSVEDREYAAELLKNYSDELDKAHILVYDGPEDGDFAQANEVINGIKSKL